MSFHKEYDVASQISLTWLYDQLINHSMDMNSVYQDGPGLRKDALLYVASASYRPDQDFRDKDQPAQTA